MFAITNKTIHIHPHILRNITRFSLMMKVPKTVNLPTESKWKIIAILNNYQKTTPFILLQQLFDYLQQSRVIQKEFPFLKSAPQLQQNSMVLHTILLHSRVNKQHNLPSQEKDKYILYLYEHFFPGYAEIIHPNIPVAKFRTHYSESFLNKFNLYANMISNLEKQLCPNTLQPKFGQYAPLFRKILYENTVPLQHIELTKFCKYYAAHKKYLKQLTFDEIIFYKVKWGFEELRLLEDLAVQDP